MAFDKEHLDRRAELLLEQGGVIYEAGRVLSEAIHEDMGTPVAIVPWASLTDAEQGAYLTAMAPVTRVLSELLIEITTIHRIRQN